MKSQRMQEEYEKQLHELEESKNQALEELTEYYEAKLLEKTTLLEEVWAMHTVMDCAVVSQKSHIFCINWLQYLSTGKT